MQLKYTFHVTGHVEVIASTPDEAEGMVYATLNKVIDGLEIQSVDREPIEKEDLDR